MKAQTHALVVGRRGELFAEDYLIRLGYRILKRNYRTPHGEIDLIVSKEGITVFVEVKTRTSEQFGMPESAVTKAKKAHIISSIAWYWQNSGDTEGIWQIDVFAILVRDHGKKVEVMHFENAIG